MRKHFTQMSQAEKAAISARANALRLSLTPHAAERLAEKRIDFPEVQAAVRRGQVIEAHNDRGDCNLTALLRATVGGRDVCVVLNLMKGVVVTAWTNSSRDNHATVDMTPYTWTANIAAILAA